MTAPHLPGNIWRMIFEELLASTFILKVLKYRLVNKSFCSEITRAFFVIQNRLIFGPAYKRPRGPRLADRVDRQILAFRCCVQQFDNLQSDLPFCRVANQVLDFCEAKSQSHGGLAAPRVKYIHGLCIAYALGSSANGDFDVLSHLKAFPDEAELPEKELKVLGLIAATSIDDIALAQALLILSPETYPFGKRCTDYRCLFFKTCIHDSRLGFSNAFSVAAYLGRLHSVQLILKYAHKVDTPTGHLFRAARLGAERGHTKIFKLLNFRAWRANMGKENETSEVCSRIFHDLLQAACRRGCQEIAEDILNAAKLYDQDKQKWIAFIAQEACHYGKIEMLKWILKKHLGTSAKPHLDVGRAVSGGHVKAIQMLLQVEGFTLNEHHLEMAVAHGHVDVIRIFLDDYKYLFVGDLRFLSLSCLFRKAIHFTQISVMRFAIARGLNLQDDDDGLFDDMWHMVDADNDLSPSHTIGHSALHFAIHRGNKPAVRELIVKLGVDATGVMSFAKTCHHEHLVQYLVELGVGNEPPSRRFIRRRFAPRYQWRSSIDPETMDISTTRVDGYADWPLKDAPVDRFWQL
ncbi:hypothetical protein BT63DRAFT_449972 [Microthyrium microscopicum]|uniref:Ankyrin n=1 Tax=Microthyrium microscopicum TaxID=703497 RepID=A0A6A6UT59_9PEZI|nr:hypothetical protein BT63DRAFT_449972 [Microthyrium microscopicum]